MGGVLVLCFLCCLSCGFGVLCVWLWVVWCGFRGFFWCGPLLWFWWGVLRGTVVGCLAWLLCGVVVVVFVVVFRVWFMSVWGWLVLGWGVFVFGFAGLFVIGGLGGCVLLWSVCVVVVFVLVCSVVSGVALRCFLLL